jgi:hypothetical protein
MNCFSTGSFCFAREIFEQSARDRGNVRDGAIKRNLVYARWHAIATHFANELQRRIAQLFIRRRAIRLTQFTNVSTHISILGALREMVGAARACLASFTTNQIPF